MGRTIDSALMLAAGVCRNGETGGKWRSRRENACPRSELDERPVCAVSPQREELKTARFSLGALCLLLAAARAQAQFPGDVPDTFRLRLGGMYAGFDTTVTFQENVTAGAPIGAGVSMEDTLGL